MNLIIIDTNNAGDTYADVGFSVSDGKHTTDGSIEIIVDAVADKPNLGFGLLSGNLQRLT